MEKETLEEAAKNKYPIENTGAMFMPNRYEVTNIYRQEGFIAGAKWQAERMYSEEEVKSAFKIGFNIGYGSPVQELDLKNDHCEKWFEQFKKK